MHIDWLPSALVSVSRRYSHLLSGRARRLSGPGRRLRSIERLEDRTVLSGAPAIGFPDTYTIDEDTPFTTTAATGVLANDFDIESDTLTATVLTDVVNGTLTLNPDGSFTYVPDANFAGADSFTYIPFDGTLNGVPTLVTLTVTAVGDTPLAVPDTYLGVEDDTITADAATGVLANDVNLDGGPMTAALVTTPLFGSVVLNPDGSFVYTPNNNFFGIDTFTYTANTAGGTSPPTAVVLNLASAVDAPVGVPDAYPGTEDSQLVVDAASGVLANDIDLDGDPLTASLTTPALFGTVVLNPDGSFTYTPNANFFGVDTFTYTANDGTSDSAPTAVVITLAGIAEAPVGVPDAYPGTEDSQLVVDAASGVLANDIDLDGDPLTASLTTPALFGTVVLSPDGSFVYTPNANFFGVDTFTYTANDGTSDSAPTAVVITLAGIAEAPVGVPDAYPGTEDSQLVVNAASGVLANDIDLDGDPLTAALVTPALFGTVVLNSDGSFTYTPNSNFVGVDTFTYMANDGTANSQPTPVVITLAGVADTPVAAPDVYLGVEDSGITRDAAAGVLANDIDLDGDALTAALVTGPLFGSLTLNPDGSFTYTPNANFAGVDTFTYQANDGTSNSLPATVTLTLTGVGDAPVGVPDAYAGAEDSGLTIDAASGVLANDIDPDGDPLTAVLFTGPQFGSLTLNADGSFTYTPDADFAGADSFVYMANDGTANSLPTTVLLTLTGAADNPVAVADNYIGSQNAVLTINAGSGVLVNDIDVDGDPLTAIVVSGPANGSLTLNPDGSFTYTPNVNFVGVDGFSYRANDGTSDSLPAPVVITVAAVAGGPVAVPDAYAGPENTTLTVTALAGVLANDVDGNGDPLTAVLLAGPLNGSLTLNSDGSFAYTPNADFNGVDQFSYAANDGTSNSPPATVILTITGVNNPPVVANDAYSVSEDAILTVLAGTGVLANDTDPEGGLITAALSSAALNGTVVLNPDGSFVYTPNADFVGVDTFSYTASDGLATSSAATVTITVIGVTDVPIAVADAYVTSEDTALTLNAAAGVLANDSDPDGDTLTANLVVGPANGTLLLNADGSLTYTPNANFTGADSFTYLANDGNSNSNTVTVSLTINSVNDLPLSANDAYFIGEDAVLTVPSLMGVLANDTDVDGDALTALLSTLPVNGTVTLNADGSFTYTPNVNFSGSDSFSYRANDGTGDGNVATVDITINSAGEPPLITTSAGAQTAVKRKRIVLDPAIQLADPDSPVFAGGELDASIQSGVGNKDVLGYRRGGAKQGLANAKHGQLRIGKTVIGVLTGGKRGVPLHIELNAQATQERVELALQSLTFRGTKQHLGTRVIQLQVTDDTQMESNVPAKSVDVVR